MIVFPNCKINLGLNITARRNDGFHNLETFFYPLPFFDALELTRSRQQIDIEFTATGIPVEGDPANNLCVRGYRLLKKDFPQLAPVHLHLHKAIPMGAGLGGGSADGAFTLKLLNNYFHLGLTDDQLLHYALRLGSDCPFFILNTPCFAGGRGELLQPLPVDLSAYKFVLVNPGIHISTAGIFSRITPASPAHPVKEIVQQPPVTWKGRLVNDMETAVFAMHPEIKKIRDALYAAGAVYASMSGSGSSVYGIFEKQTNVTVSLPSAYLVKELAAT